MQKDALGDGQTMRPKSAIRYRLSAIGCPLSVIRYPLSAIRYRLSAIRQRKDMRWSDCQASDVRWAVCPNAKRFRGFRPPSGSALGGPGSAHRTGWFRGEFDMPLPGAAKTIQPGFAQGAADWRSGPRRSILSMLCPVHPFPLRGTSPQGETRDMREKTGSAMLHVSSRWFPLWWLAPPPCPVRSMSLDSRVAGLPYESSSFATPASGGTMDA